MSDNNSLNVEHSDIIGCCQRIYLIASTHPLRLRDVETALELSFVTLERRDNA